jgi:hypothetical protein
MAGKKGMRWAKRTMSPDLLQELRNKIEAGKIINRLNSFILGDQKMEPHQVTGALGLLRKVIPDLSATELSGDPERPVTVDYRESIERKLLPELFDAQDTGKPPSDTLTH